MIMQFSIIRRSCPLVKDYFVGLKKIYVTLCREYHDVRFRISSFCLIPALSDMHIRFQMYL